MMNRRKTIRQTLIYIGLIACTVVLILPFLWVVSTSLKGNEEIFAIPPEFIPETFHWESYAQVFERMPFLTYYL